MRPPQVEDSPRSWLKTLLICFLALGCGFLSYSFGHILKTAHIHVRLSHHHKISSFCAFTGCKYNEEMQGSVLLTL